MSWQASRRGSGSCFRCSSLAGPSLAFPLAAATGGLDFFRPWLIGAYIVFVIAMATGGAITGPWAGRMASAATSSADDQPSPELQLVMHEPRALIGSIVLMSAIVVIIFLMVFKPGS